MKIKYCDSLRVAHEVRKALDKIIPAQTAKGMAIESWANCREQGLCFISYTSGKKVVVSEARSSDSILVITGTNKSFNMQTNQPSEEDYQHGKYFDPDTYDKAAEYIAGYFS